jgi:hypothetical protein
VIKGQQSAAGHEMEGLYYLDPNKPKELRRIDLSAIAPPLQKQIRDVACQEQTILFHILTPDKQRSTLYALKIGQRPIILAEKTKGFAVPQYVSVQDKYILSFSLTLRELETPYSTSPEKARQDCQFSHVQEGYRVVCLRPDRGTKQLWLVKNGFLAKYIWDETIRVNKDGQYQRISNPEPPLKLPDGTELKQGYVLRDLENRIVQEIPTKQGIHRTDEIKPNPRGSYLYATCSKVGDYTPLKTFYGRVCRLKLDGTQKQWEEVFSLQKEPNERASLHEFDVNNQDDVVVIRRANRTSPAIWKHDARRASVAQLPAGQLSQEIGAVRISPDGQTISYVDKRQLVFVRVQGDKP